MAHGVHEKNTISTLQQVWQKFWQGDELSTAPENCATGRCTNPLDMSLKVLLNNLHI